MSEKESKKYKFSLVSTGVTLGSYFLIKYGIAAQFFATSELRLVYSLGLILACMILGKAVESAVEDRKNKAQ